MTTNQLTLSETPRPLNRPLDDEGLVLAALTRPVLPGVLVGHALPAVTNSSASSASQTAAGWRGN